MAENALAKKLLIKPGQRILILNAPPNYVAQLGELPPDSVLSQKAEGLFDFVHVFAHSKAELDQLAPQAIQLLKKDALFWISYPKVSSKAYVDLNRDKGWGAVTSAGFEGVSLISIDETWSAMRFRPVVKPAEGRVGSRSNNVVSKQEFEVELIKDDNTSGVGFAVPFKVQEVYGTKAQVKVRGTIDGVPYRGLIAPYGGIHYMGVIKELREAIGRKAGDRVRVVMEIDTEERTVVVPDDFRQALEKNEVAREIFDKFAYSHRKAYVQWIEDAKRQETRRNRIEKAVERIAEGIKFS